MKRYYGRVAVVGNDPHTQLVLKTADDVYALQDGEQSRLLQERYQDTFVTMHARLVKVAENNTTTFPLLDVVEIIFADSTGAGDTDATDTGEVVSPQSNP